MRRLLALCVFALALFFSARASAAFHVPPLTGFVVDPSHVLKESDRSALDQELGTYRRGTSHHVAVLVTDSLGGESIEDVAYRTFNTWGLGDKQRDDGVLVVLAPTERRVRIEVGRGLGGQLTDAQSSRIVQEKIIPQMRESHFYEAARDGTRAVEEALAPHVTTPTHTADLEDKTSPSTTTSSNLEGKLAVGAILFASVFFFVYAAIALQRRAKRNDGRRRNGGAHHYDPTLMMMQHHAPPTTFDAGSLPTTTYTSSTTDFSGGGGSSGGGGASGSY